MSKKKIYIYYIKKIICIYLLNLIFSKIVLIISVVLLCRIKTSGYSGPKKHLNQINKF